MGSISRIVNVTGLVLLALLLSRASLIARAQEPAPVTPGAATPTLAPVPIDAEVTFAPSRQTLNVGDSWSVTGEIYNRSKDRAIWIVDTKTILIVAPEVFGDVDARYGLPALFPTVAYPRDGWGGDHPVRIEAGSKYPVVWRLGASNPLTTLYGYSFFSPGTFRATALVHYWTDPPTLVAADAATGSSAPATVANMDASATLTASRDISFDASLWVLLVGAPIGGILAFTLLGAVRTSPLSPLPTRSDRLKRFALRFVGAVLLPIVVTILLARLSSSDSPITIRVRDVWGAIAIGFVVQWAGLPWLTRLLPEGGEQNTHDEPDEDAEASATMPTVTPPDGRNNHVGATTADRRDQPGEPRRRSLG